MVAYLLIIKDVVPAMFGIENTSAFGPREIIMVVTSLVIMLPLALMRDMASLSFTSFLSVSADFVLVLFISAYSPIGESLPGAGGFWTVLGENVVNSRLFIGLGIISTAMACQHSAFIVNGSLEEKSSAAWATVTKYSLMIALVMCALLGTMGFLGFLDETQGNVLNNFQEGSVAANGARGLLAITMFFTVSRRVDSRIFLNYFPILNARCKSVPDGIFCG
jgi:solute carrier family 38 (sodium-coupled neutral amino acid transporter), member 11